MTESKDGERTVLNFVEDGQWREVSFGPMFLESYDLLKDCHDAHGKPRFTPLVMDWLIERRKKEAA